MAEFIEANEPRVIAFEAYLSDDETEVTGVQVHPDADSMAFHMQVAFEKIMEFDQYLDTESVEVYGVPNDVVLGMMKQIGDQFGSAMSMRVRGTPWVGSRAAADPHWRRWATGTDMSSARRKLTAGGTTIARLGARRARKSRVRHR
jgi:hypothetical protein